MSADIQLQSFDIQKLFNNYQTRYSGLVDLDIKALGDIYNPGASGSLRVSDLTIDSIRIGSVQADINVKDKKFEWDLIAVTGQYKRHKIKRRIFLLLSLRIVQ